MYTDEAVNRLIETLAEEAERDLRHAKNAESPEDDVAYALYSSSKYALNTVREWAFREKQPGLHHRSAESVALKAENARLRELLGIVDGHAGEIVRTLAGEVE